MEPEKEGVPSIKEQRIRAAAISYYSRSDVRQNMLGFAASREVVPRYFEGFGKRPDALQYESDILELAKKGATSFHCSEEIWREPLELSTELTGQQLNELRAGWDLLIDVDSRWLDYSKIAAELLVKALEHNGVKSVNVKFSGNKGFHIIVPWKAFPQVVHGQETRKMFPEFPRAICQYLNDMIKEQLIERISCLTREGAVESGKYDSARYIRGEEQVGDAIKKVMPDIILVSPRHLFRMPYSLHEKTALASVVIGKDKIADFDVKDADPLKVQPINFIPDAQPGEATELLLQALDYKPVESQEQIEQRQKRESGEYKGREFMIKDLTPELYPPSIKKILEGMKTDGRKRALFILLNFFRSLKVEQDKIEKAIEEWNRKNYELLLPGYIKAQIQWHMKSPARLPPNFDKPYYSAIGIVPTPEELAAKNPVNYVARKSFASSQNNDRKPRTEPKNQE